MRLCVCAGLPELLQQKCPQRDLLSVKCEGRLEARQNHQLEMAVEIHVDGCHWYIEIIVVSWLGDC